MIQRDEFKKGCDSALAILYAMTMVSSPFNLINKRNREKALVFTDFWGQEMASAAWAMAITLERRHLRRGSEILGRLRHQAVARVDQLEGKDRTSAQSVDGKHKNPPRQSQTYHFRVVS
jgi:hypothetical protein